MFHQPCHLEQALELRAQFGPRATVINGGTDVVVALNHGAPRPAAFLDLSRVDELRTIERANGSVLLGAGVTFAQLGRLHLRALREAALSVGGPAIRNMGTIGGNIVTASPAGDGSVALLAMHAEVELSSAARGPRWLPLVDFFIDYRKTALNDDELLTRVRVPHNPRTRWYKIGKRGAVNISIVCCAVSRNPDGRHGIAFGCVGPMPLRAQKAEALLDAAPSPAAAIDEAAALCATEVRPIDDHRGSAEYRCAMCVTLSRRLLADLTGGDGKGDADA
jgi:CO/xanthine dehydrogenase FAD-binding subunit